MSLMERFANPEIFDTLSFGEKMLGSTITLIMGMGLTIGVLLLVWGFVILMTKVINKSEKKAEEPVKAEPVPVQQPVSQQNPDEQVIAAVIAAAVAAYEGSGGTSNLVVRKITRISGNPSPWSASAKEECIASRRI